MNLETDPLVWIIAGGILMCVIALVGACTLPLKEATLKRILLPLVALSAGSLLGGAFFHMIPESVEKIGSQTTVYIWVVLGFSIFLLLEQLLHYHHCHRESTDCRKPLTYLILIGDGIHNFIGGIAIAGTFLIDVRLGITTWLAAAAHEIPQEIGDFGVLVHGGLSTKKALLYNVLSASTFLVGGILAYMISFTSWVYYLIPFAAGNFLYIGASDLVPEVNRHHHLTNNIIHFLSFVSGILILLSIRMWLHDG
jgi:zinc and cadmium transporter